MSIMLERVLQLANERHGSAIELCKALGVARNTVTEWKAGRSKSYTKYAPQIAAYYGVSLDWLSGATDDKEQKNAPTPKSEGSDTRRKIDMLLDDMTDDQLKRYLEVLQVLQK